MAIDKSIKSILIIGAGPIVIGQACEFDYSGSQAAKALKSEGYKVILVNSNPATIMTDPSMADATYIEPLTTKFLERIIEKERPDAILPTLGGQTALNLAMALYEDGVFEKFNVKILGASASSIEIAENRWKFKEAMEKVGIATLKAHYVKTVDEGIVAGAQIGYPLMLRPSYILGGGGTGLVYGDEELVEKLENAFKASPTQEVLIEESIYGWKEFELEVMRDNDGNGVIICGIENIDPMGIHTGDSITVAPIQTLSDKEYQLMRDEALLCLETIGIATGGSNVQFAVNPKNGERRVIEMNPRVSRSSALASKATGFPIAKFAALLAVGYNLTELTNDITGSTPASFEPVQDYVVVKIPRFDFPKFPSTDDVLGTSMQSVGEVMSIASTFTESLTKAIRSLEIGKTGIRNIDNRFINLDRLELEKEIAVPRPRRIFAVLEALRRNWSVSKISNLSYIDEWFLYEIEKSFNVNQETTPTTILKMLGWTEDDIDNKDIKDELSKNRVYKLVDTCSAEFLSITPYLYSTTGTEDDDISSNKEKVVVIGSGPNRIGQGIEFDYCCVHGVDALKENGYEAIMINSNPETVSTDYDTADKLYFEPLNWQEVEAVLLREKPKSVIIQLGGQTPLKLAEKIVEKGYTIAGSSIEVIDSTEDRELFQKLCTKENIKQPISNIAANVKELSDSVTQIGYPVLLRPSYVLGGRAMRVVNNEIELSNYLDVLSKSDEDGNPFNSGPLLVDEYLTNAIEIDVDLISDGTDVVIAGILEHLEPAGVHSGDSTAVLPPYSIEEKMLTEIKDKSIKLALSLNVKGLLNIQFAIKENELYILEANPRASRTMPFVAKVTKNQIIKAGTLIMLGHKIKDILKDTDYLSSKTNKIAVKKAIFPWSRFPAEDTMLGPEMKATGEVLGIGSKLGIALNKAYAAAGVEIGVKQQGIFITLSDEDKNKFLKTIRKYIDLEFKIYATEGTSEFLLKNNIESIKVGRADDEAPTSLTIMQKDLISLVINTPTFANEYTDGWKIRRLAHDSGVAVVSSVREAEAFIEAYVESNNALVDIGVIQDVS
ncbi:carbamoyl-phosphate synthase large subunit [Candidatus Actinomarina sp.]|nr:carbamoyl-phosphate synthase large subunit [Acidimicrobiia bacterium]MDA9197795.1 carbamoyl-phosphate synthase large subunit [Acidimicrobiia bacterium]MDB2532578.1 carbamoyl-phosphate synthase large subunit [Candidatus Actinomarina sp.]MDB3866720.1 carbamoyl-phosphate synthase large subunit [Acidimicrobiia bacterium]MDC3278188.1 carbamoyl-phosphate synthase large subunit [Acidimicrobiia bacterium]